MVSKEIENNIAKNSKGVLAVDEETYAGLFRETSIKACVKLKAVVVEVGGNIYM